MTAVSTPRKYYIEGKILNKFETQVQNIIAKQRQNTVQHTQLSSPGKVTYLVHGGKGESPKINF